MKFEVFGPYFFPTETIIKSSHVEQLKSEVRADSSASQYLDGPGCYVFGVKSSGAKWVQPWYVGKAERQSVLREATNAQHLQLYNEIFDEYKRGHPALFFLPAITPGGKAKPVASKERSMPTVSFLEDWLIATSLKRNQYLWNVRSTKMLRELSVRGVFNATKGDLNKSAASLKSCLGL
jgi:hypothetical protein